MVQITGLRGEAGGSLTRSISGLGAEWGCAPGVGLVVAGGIICTSWDIMSTICVILSSSIDMVEAEMAPLLAVVVAATVVAGSSSLFATVAYRRCDDNNANVSKNHEILFGFGKKRAGGC